MPVGGEYSTIAGGVSVSSCTIANMQRIDAVVMAGVYDSQKP